MNTNTVKYEVKPRFDGGGSEFGKMHRWLGRELGMFDIDYLDSNKVSRIDYNTLEITRIEPLNENENFFEYKTNFSQSIPVFSAVFDVKHHHTKYVEDGMLCKVATATWALFHVCKKLSIGQPYPCRFFIVIATNGKQPFQFHEIIDSDESNTVPVLNYYHIGTLDYVNDLDGPEKVKNYWSNTLKLL